MQCGLIRSNTHYAELFHASTIGATITDTKFRVLLSSAAAKPMSEARLRQTQSEPYIIDGGLRLSSAPVHNGFVVWQDDVSELTRILKELEQADEELKGRKEILAEEYQTKHKRQALAEKNRLYYIVQPHTAAKLARLSFLTEQLADASDPSTVMWLIAHIAILTAYIKRRNNLIFIAEENGMVSSRELEYSILESMSNLSLLNINCQLHMAYEGALSFAQTAFLYDSFERIVESVLDEASSLFVSISNQQGKTVMCCSLVCDAAFSDLTDAHTTMMRESENEWVICCTAPEEGEDL